jgi:7-cyano-7-deazaguanine tRNA-ribosyltransferase
MVSYADFHQMPGIKRRAMESGLHKSLGIPKRVKIYLDNGAFYFSSRGFIVNPKEYEEFANLAKPDWKPVPQDFIPTPKMGIRAQRHCLNKTMFVNNAYEHNGFVPVIHISKVLSEYITAIKANARLVAKSDIALGAIVPQLLRMPKSQPYQDTLNSIHETRQSFTDKKIHLFGVGGDGNLAPRGFNGHGFRRRNCLDVQENPLDHGKPLSCFAHLSAETVLCYSLNKVAGLKHWADMIIQIRLFAREIFEVS